MMFESYMQFSSTKTDDPPDWQSGLNRESVLKVKQNYSEINYSEIAGEKVHGLNIGPIWIWSGLNSGT